MSLQASVFFGSLVVALCSYLLGSVSWSVIVSKLFFHKDVRNFGSGNAGMTNILRTFGKGAAAIVAVGDFGKSILTVLISRIVFANLFGALPFDIGYVAGIFTILGHLFPLYFHFKGGKGVLTAMGMILIINPLVFAIVVSIAVVVLLLCKIVSAASLVGATLYPIVTFIVLRATSQPILADTVYSIVIALIVIYMHRVNIRRLFNGTEYKFGKPKQK